MPKKICQELAGGSLSFCSGLPSTLARDVRTLVGGGYTVERVQPIDLFPQSEHVETVLEAVLTAP